MFAATKHKISMNLIAHNNYTGFAADRCKTAQSFFIPLDAYRIMRIAENHHFGLLARYHLFKAFKVHAVVLSVEKQRIFHYFAAISLHYCTERGINRRLDHNPLTLFGKIIYRIGKTFHYPWNKRQLVARNQKTMATVIPIDNRLPIAVGGFGITQNRMRQTFKKCFRNLWAYGKIKVGNPQWSEIMTTEYAV